MTIEEEFMAVASMRAVRLPAKKHSVAAKTDAENGKSTQLKIISAKSSAAMEWPIIPH